MRLRITCGVCDFDTELDDATAAQIEMQWDLFTARHKHTPGEVREYIELKCMPGSFVHDAADGDDDEEGGEAVQ